MDDLVTSTPDVERAYNFSLESKRVMADGGMNLRKWHSNSLELLERINSVLRESDQRQVPAPSQLGGQYLHKICNWHQCFYTISKIDQVLGVLWNSVFDVFTFEVDGLVEYANSLPVNRRSVLKLSAKIFDLLGLISAFVV